MKRRVVIATLVTALLVVCITVPLTSATSIHRQWIVIAPTVPRTYFGPFNSRTVAQDYAFSFGPVSFPTAPGRVALLRRPDR